MVKIRGMKKLFREKYEFKITARKYVGLGVRLALRFLDEAREYFGKIFRVFETKDGYIQFEDFRKILKKVDPSRADWKIHAIFQKACGTDSCHQLCFNDFIKCAMNNVLMDSMIDLETVLTEEKKQEAAESNTMPQNM